ncbi:MAG: metallopeptidase TldD-related protein [Anaerolineales bacterium]
MLKKIVDALKARKDLAGWSLSHINSRGAQVYAVPKQVEARRGVDEEKFRVVVFRRTQTSDGSPAMGSGDVTLLPGGDIAAALDQAALVAGLVKNPLHTIPSKKALPEVDLADPEIRKDSLAILENVMSDLQKEAANEKDVQLTSAECFAEVESTHFLNSNGIEAEQEATDVHIEFVLQSRAGEKNSETHRELTRRRVSDLNLPAEVERRARYTRDLLNAEPPPTWDGPVVIRGDALAIFMAGDGLTSTTLRMLSSASTKYAKVTPWEVGQTVFRGEVKGDPFTLWANRRIPFGNVSNRFDAEGLPAQRVAIIRDNKLITFHGPQRYADYLEQPPTGDFGTVELPSGKRAAASLLGEPHVEICMFSWFNPEPVSGDFSSEIRLGYLVENGTAKPFKGGQLVGNLLDALANAHWSQETELLGNYMGPITARFNQLKVAPS